MRNHTHLMLLLFATTMIGCSTLRGNSTLSISNDSSQATNENIPVSIYRQNFVQVPLPPNGLSLRATLADARDLASSDGAIVASYALNNVLKNPALKNADQVLLSSAIGGDLETLKENPIYAGEEIVILQRGKVKIFIPSMMVNETAAGNIRVAAGDVLATGPLTVLANISTKAQGLAPINTFTLKSSLFNSMELPIGKAQHRNVTFVSDLFQFARWEGNGFGNPPMITAEAENSYNPGPNTVVLSRVVADGSSEVFILPCQLVTMLGSLIGDTYNMVGFPQFASRLQVLDGDVVEITRLEQVPIVAAGLAIPATPRIPTESVTNPPPCPLGPQTSNARHQVFGSVSAFVHGAVQSLSGLVGI